ncbi:MAG: binding-protein-dependent transport system inner rane component [Frankiales bacterium]|nr:binding-protein-dependent transport system inner rane component [Frankiales bacterium]
MSTAIEGTKTRTSGPATGRKARAYKPPRVVKRADVFWGLGSIIVMVYAIFPVLWILSISLKDATQLGTGGNGLDQLIPKNPTLENYRTIFDSNQFVKPLINSIGISLITTVIAVVIAGFAAYAIARLDFPGKTLLLSGALAIAMFPQVSIIGPLFNIWRATGLYDTWAGLILPYLTFALPLSIWTLAAFFRQIPWDLEQAAQVDGATPFQAFRKVVVPLAAPGVFTSAIIVFIFCWNDFLFSISLTSTTNSRTVPAATTFFNASTVFIQPTGQISAAAVVVTVPIIIMVLVFQRRIVAGLTSGAVKG